MVNRNIDILLNAQKISDLQKQMNDGEIISQKHRKPLMTFTDDDGSALFPDKWKDIIATKQIPVTCCVSTNKIGGANYMTWYEILQMQELGVEVISHGHNDIDYTSLSEAKIREEIETAQQILKEKNCTYNIHACTADAYNANVRAILRDYFRCATITGTKTTAVPYPPMKTYGIYRLPMLASGTTQWTLDEYKAKIDECVANKGWLIWSVKSSAANFNATLQGFIKQLIDYAVGLGVEIVNMENGIDIIGNIIDIGDPISDSSYFTLGCDGTIYSSNGLCLDNDKYTISSIPTSFPENEVTVALIGDTVKTGFPHDAQGLLTTYRLGGAGIDRQEFRPKDYNEIWVRHIESDSKWGYFVPLTPASGATGDRPYDNYIGCPFYDTTLNKPIWVKTAGVHALDTLTITAGATSSGNITITTSSGADVVVAVTAEMTIEEVDEAIRAATFTGFEVGGVAGSGVISFKDLITQAGSAAVFTDTGITGVTGTFVRTTTGVATVWVDATGTTA